MRRLVPYPALSLFLLGVWLMLNQSLGLGHLLLGSVLGLVLGGVFARLRPPGARVRNHHLLLLLAAQVAVDVVRSNIAVAGIILRPGASRVTSGFMEVPLELRDRYGLAVLATIVTSTPGTIWVKYDADADTLLIHVLDLVDEDAWIRKIKGRYERILREVFE